MKILKFEKFTSQINTLILNTVLYIRIDGLHADNTCADCARGGELFTGEDSERALKYYVLACEMGERTGCKLRDKLQKK
eukprot:SAG31_NODE_4116_length_3567_cov_2.159746_2_plen_79_part_00